nr:MAG: hypothetical protein [Bacteriophage sp.]
MVISLLVKLWYSLVSLFSLNNPFLTFRVDLLIYRIIAFFTRKHFPKKEKLNKKKKGFSKQLNLAQF